MNGNFCLKITAKRVVVYPGIHLFGWTREEAIEFMMESGRFPDSMGDDFDIREFHDRVLENGTMPLKQLRSHIEAWILKKPVQTYTP